MATYPFIIQDSVLTIDISNEPKLIFGKQFPCRLDSIRCTNTTNNDISVTVTILKEVDEVATSGYTSYQEFIAPFKTIDLLNIERGGLIYTANGDTLFAYCDSSIKKFDCLVSFRGILQQNQSSTLLR